MSVAADDTAGDLPVRELTSSLAVFGRMQEPSAAQCTRERQAVSRISREDLEDRYLRLHEENLQLKQHMNQQEEKIRRMATKLIKLVKDRKREQQMLSAGVPLGSRDVETEEMLEGLQEKVQAVQKENETLKQRLLAARQQLQLQRRHAPYGHVPPRINTGFNTGLRASPPLLPPRGQRVQMQPQRYGHSLLQDARTELSNMKNIIKSHMERIEELEQTGEKLKVQLKQKEEEHEECVLRLKEMEANARRSSVKEDTELLRLERALVEKVETCTLLEGRFLQLQESQKILKTSHDAVMTKVDELNLQLKEEQMKSRQLEVQLQAVSLANMRNEELQERIADLEKERDLLKDNCDKLCHSAFDVSQEQKWRSREQHLNLQIAQLETGLKAELTDKNTILDKIRLEQEQNEKLWQEKEDLQLKFLEQKQQLDHIKDQIKLFSKEGETDLVELSEALMIIKARKSQKTGELSFLQNVEEAVQQDLERSMKELQATYAETVQELEKTRNMLLMQHKINKAYQAEVEAGAHTLEKLKAEYELKVEKLAQQLDMKTGRIKKLEAQLRDVAYGTRAHPLLLGSNEEDLTDDVLHLQRGQNLLEVHVGQAELSQAALDTLGDSDPATFCTYAFYDFELQVTPVGHGSRPRYSFTSQHAVHMDEQFLHYLQTGVLTLELQVARGLDFRTVAAASIRLRRLLQCDGKLSGSVPLLGVSGEVENFGLVEYCLKLKLPVEQAGLLYQERVKALGYLTSALGEEQVPVSLSSPTQADSTEGVNHLLVSVLSCSHLQSLQPSVPPNPYVVYKLYNFPDHDTHIQFGTSNPQFHDETSFVLPACADVQRYLETSALSLYVFDDLEPESHVYLGKSSVPLAPLAQGRSITGVFQLSNSTGLPCGTIHVRLKWKDVYLPADQEKRQVCNETPEKLVPEKEEEARHEQASKKFPQHRLQETAKPKHMRSRERELSKRVSFQQQDVPESTFHEAGADDKDTPVQALCQDEEEESHMSEGQLATGTSSSTSQESEIPEDICFKAADGRHPSESSVSDSDDCIVAERTSEGRRQASKRIRIEITSLSLAPGARIAKDDSISRLFVEYRFLDMPSVETPLSLPKPPVGKSVHYNYSSVVPLDTDENAGRRELLRAALRGDAQQMEIVKFTVVSDPPEEEQELECEDVGEAFLRITDIMEQQRDLIDISLDIMDVMDSSEVLGHLTVTVEALEALRSVLEHIPLRSEKKTGAQQHSKELS